MNFPDLKLIPDVQSNADTRQQIVDRVGVRGLKYPMQLVDLTGEPQGTVVEADLSVELAEDVKGTHMSRFIGLLEGRDGVLTLDGFHALLFDMVELLNARAGTIEFRFPFFVRKAAPVSGVSSLMDYQVALTGVIRLAGTKRMFLHSIETAFEYEFHGRRHTFAARAALPEEFEKFL